MSRLFLKEFRALASTESSSDSPYFVVLVGHPGSSPTMSCIHIRREAWDGEVDSGDLITANMAVADNVDSSTLVLAALMEEDDGPDLVGADLQCVIDHVKPTFAAFGSVQGMSLSDLADKVRPEFRKAINQYSTNDDLIGVRRVHVTTNAGLLPLVNYEGDSGAYRVRFSMQN